MLPRGAAGEPLKAMRKYTLVYHVYIGHGSYIIEFKRVDCTPKGLEQYKKNHNLHFIINGHPKMVCADGIPVFD